MTGEIELHLPTGSGAYSGEQLTVLKDGHQAAVRLVRDVLQLDRLDVFAVDAPDMVIPSWGCGGCTYSARSVVLAVDSSHPATMSAVRTTLVHEFHHVARERGPGCGTSLRDRVVSEGLAMLFEEEILGAASEFAHQTITDDQVGRMIESLDEDPADDGRWCFHAGDMPLWLGYTVGYRWARSYAQACGLSAAALVNISAKEVTAHSPARSDELTRPDGRV
ncbi:DUF2268 domain-containing putative Zn-dependent protease [Flexivirga caeni]|uniref:DUF2268 domain-containing putative Zn-dependent protease n=1 Tax=Flexivirga caeni TaxID=2294115 RepID=UPI001315311B|nr:DUF2268 domain-containing putative Zn-dependent protease [Flexivirga caeni]